jgi:CMP-N-acetylneuraminic acid synthetase
MPDPNYIGLITARGGSKSIPRKNVKPLAGRPLVAWTIEAALQSECLGRVIVSTDDEEIAQVSRACGAEVPFMRPQELARDDSPHIESVNHAIHWLAAHEDTHPEYIMLLQPSSPLRTSEDIDAAVNLAKERNATGVVSVCETRQHPYLSKQILEDGTIADFVSSNLDYARRQDLPKAYALNGAIYLNRCKSLVRERTFQPKGTYAYVMPPERSLDVDEAWDLYLADLVLRNKHGYKAY